jgi:hypothetical protein
MLFSNTSMNSKHLIFIVLFYILSASNSLIADYGAKIEIITPQNIVLQCLPDSLRALVSLKLDLFKDQPVYTNRGFTPLSASKHRGLDISYYASNQNPDIFAPFDCVVLKWDTQILVKIMDKIDDRVMLY